MIPTLVNNSDPESITATIKVMLGQENNGYHVCDYMGDPMCSDSFHFETVDADCRFRMVEWCYQVVDFCKFSRDTVTIAMSFLDRFMCTQTGSQALTDRKMYQLAAMTSLYTAVKIHEPEAMDPQVIASLSRGTYTCEQVEAMEFSILKAIEWRMNPPTALSFVHNYIALIPDSVMSSEVREVVLDLAKYQAELAVSNYNFVPVKESIIAGAILLNAVECVDPAGAALECLRLILSRNAGVESCSQWIFNLRNALYTEINKQPDGARHFGCLARAAHTPVKAITTEGSSIEHSPRCVSA